MGKIERKTKVTRKQGRHESCLETAASKCLRAEPRVSRTLQHVQINRFGFHAAFSGWFGFSPTPDRTPELTSLCPTHSCVCAPLDIRPLHWESRVMMDGTGRNRKPWYKWLWLEAQSQAWLAVTLDLILWLMVAFSASVCFGCCC